MDPVVFVNSVIEELPEYAKYGSTLQNVSDGVYKGRYFFNPLIKCIDGDRLVGNKDRSVDSIIGIGDYSNNRTTNKSLLIVRAYHNVWPRVMESLPLEDDDLTLQIEIIEEDFKNFT